MQTSKCSWLAIDRNVLIILLGMIVFLFLANVLLIPFASELKLIDSPFRYVIKLVDLNTEGNFATWCSSMLLLLNSLNAYMITRCHWLTKRRLALRTAIMAAGFLILSIDDFVGAHEYLEKIAASLISNLNGNSGSLDSFMLKKYLGPLFSMCLVFIFIVLIAGPYLRAVSRKNISLLIACIACVFTVGLAEIVYRISGCVELWCFRIEVVFEEISELSALLLFLTFQSRELVNLGSGKK